MHYKKILRLLLAIADIHKIRQHISQNRYNADDSMAI